MQQKEIVKDFYGKIIGYIVTDALGNKIVRDFYGKILGRYDKRTNLTKDFYGKIIAKGDRTNALLPVSRR
jgi:hypothetical protein